VKFFLDNCLAIRHARALNEMVRPDHSFTHLREKFLPDTPDEEWIRTLGNEREWIVISGDYRMGKSQYGRRAWHESGLTVFFLAKGWMNISPLQQHSKIAAILDEIIYLSERNSSGAGFSVSVNGKITKIYP
jgi:predicted nuclease of predicted toxin-antitoxin system